MLNRLAAIAAACLLACAPALAQDVRTLPLAAPLTGAEKMPSVQGTGCASKTTPCTAVAVTPSLISTFLAPAFQPRDADLDAIAVLSTVDFGRQLLTKADAASVRSTLGLGSAALASTGTSGAAVPLLNDANSWSAAQTFNAGWQTQLGGGTIRPVAGSSAATPGFTVYSGSRAVTLFAGQGYNGLIYDSAGSLVIGREPYANHTGGTVGSSVATATFNSDGSTTFAGPVTAPSVASSGAVSGTTATFSSTATLGATTVNGFQAFRRDGGSAFQFYSANGGTFYGQFNLDSGSGAGYLDVPNGQLVLRSAGGTTTATIAAGAITPNTDNTMALGSSSVRFSTLYAAKHCYTATVCDFAGNGTPLGNVVAAIGSTYRRTDGGAGTTFYVKESGTDASGWVAK